MKKIKRITWFEIIIGIIALVPMAHFLEVLNKKFIESSLTAGIVLAACIWAIVKIEHYI